MNPFDLTKPVQQQNGRAARILCTDAKNSKYPVVALAVDADGEEHPLSYTKEGKHMLGCTSPSDLINVPLKKTVKFWVNVYEDGSCVPHVAEETAHEEAGLTRIACAYIEREVTEGEGL